MVSNILVLGAVGLILVLVLFGFLLGLLRGFRKSLYFTIIFIAVVIISFIFATMLSKSVYSGSTLWRFSKRIIPSKMKEGSEAVNSLKEFVRFYLEHNYTEAKSRRDSLCVMMSCICWGVKPVKMGTATAP